MTVSTRRTLLPSLAATIVLAAPGVTLGQSLSSRPASVALTVVVPERAPRQLTSIDAAAIVRHTDARFDVETLVGVANRTASRVEVRLGMSWEAETARVLVRNSAGAFEVLATDAPIAAAVSRGEPGDTRSRLTFRIEADRPIPQEVSVPVEYRVTVGEGDQIAVWTFPATLEISGGSSSSSSSIKR